MTQIVCPYCYFVIKREIEFIYNEAEIQCDECCKFFGCEREYIFAYRSFEL